MSLLSLAGRAATGKLVLLLAGALLLTSTTAGWALWRLAGAGSRCDVRLLQASQKGNAALRDLVAGQEASLALVQAEQDTELLRLRSRLPERAVERVVIYRDRIERIEVPICTVREEQITELLEVLR